MPFENDDELTPKQRYEKRKADRDVRKNADWQTKQKLEQADAFDMADRFVMAFERIADAFEKKFA